MGSVLDRGKSDIARSGESVTFTKLGGTAGTYACDMIIQVCDSSSLNAYFDSITLSGFTRPVVKCSIAGDSPVAVNDTFTRDGVVWTVRYVFKNRVMNDVLDITVLATHA